MMTKKSTAYLKLEKFLNSQMSMTGAYQPALIKAILEGGGVASRRQIAREFLKNDIGQIRYYEGIVSRYPTQTLIKHGIIKKDGFAYYLTSDFDGLEEWEKLSLISLCEQHLSAHISLKQEQLASLKRGLAPSLSGSARYNTIKRAATRCEACGRSNENGMLHIDHIIPRERGGTNDSWNLQVLCETCNTQKRHLDDTDFSAIKESYFYREFACTFCELAQQRIISENELALAIRDGYPVTKFHTLIIPKRHVSDYFDLFQPERNAIQSLLEQQRLLILESDPSVTGFNVGINSGADAGQTIFHCHVHLIPRRKGDVEEPRGGVRGVIPARQKY
jgi:ATP adenylyltransferase